MNFHDWHSRRMFAEVSQDVVDKVTDWIGEKDRPFDNLFGDKWRIVIPLRDPKMLDFRDKLEEDGFEVDLDAGKVYRTIKNQRGESRREQNIGRAIGKSKKFTKSDLDWWSTVAAQKDKTEFDKFKIVLSRHPIDVVRMSDHRNISSCHSQGSDYFRCAVAEAMGHAPIAYLVKSEDIKSEDDWLQQSEIFQDSQGYHNSRNVSGITPVARLRLRRYEHKDDGYEIAIPEERVYGSDKSGFLDSVLDWARQNQSQVLEDEPDMDEFFRTGGSYQDNPDSDLFNQFFDTENSYGNVDHEGEEEDEYAGQAEMWEEECENITEEFNKILKHCGVWYSVEEFGEDGQPYIWSDGRISVQVPVEMFKKRDGRDFWSAATHQFGKDGGDEELRKKNWAEERRIKKGILDVLGGINYDWKEYSLDDFEIGESPAGNSSYNTNHDNVVLQWSIRDSDGSGDGPDDYRTFCEWVRDEFDVKYDQFRGGVMKALVEIGYLNENPMQKFFKAHEEDDFGDFKNFHVYVNAQEAEAFQADAWIKLGHLNDVNMPNMTTSGARYGISHTELTKFPGFGEFYKVFLAKLLQIEKTKRASDALQKRLPGMAEPQKRMPFKASHVRPKIRFRMDEERMVYAILGFELKQGTKHTKSKNTIEFIKYLDDNFEKIVRVARQVYELTVKRKFSNIDWGDEEVKKQIPWNTSAIRNTRAQTGSEEGPDTIRTQLSYGHPDNPRGPLDDDDMDNRPKNF